MSTVLVYIEHSSGTVSKSALSVITAGLKAKVSHSYSKVVGVLLGSSDVVEASKAVLSYGLDEVIYVNSDVLKNFIVSSFAEALEVVVKDVSPNLILATASSKGRDFIPYLSSMLSAPQASDVIDFFPGGSFKRPMYAGNIFSEVELNGDVKVATIRSSAFSAPESGATCAVRELSVTLTSPTHTEYVSYDTVKSERPELGDADVVVSGGRAMKSAENFETVLSPLADVLGAAIGASRAAVDSGYAPNDWQVGQTGKIVAPKLYIAVGISGAVQHLAGMKDSKVIVAINKDPEAPIFEVADYGLVADLYQAVPELTEKIKASKN
jgi:electron transfer flavoprotein alpha subunit